MDIREHSSKFTIYVLTPELDAGAAIKVALSRVGYDTYYFEGLSVLEQRMSEAAPHVLVFTTQGLQGQLNDFVEKARTFNPDIRFVIISDFQQFETIAQYDAYGVEEILSQEATALDARCVWAVNRICEKLYFNYQNEQLFDQWKEFQLIAQTAEQKTKEIEAELQKKSSISAAPAPAVITQAHLATRIGEYKTAESKEQIIQHFMNSVQSPPLIFFKYLPTVGSFVATHASGFDMNLIQGVGCYLSKDEVKTLSQQVAVGELPLSFSKLLNEAFHFQQAKVLPLFVQNRLEGVVVYANALEAQSQLALSEEFSLFALNYSHFCLEKRVDQLEVQDFITEVYNRSFYQQALHNEIDRARRQKIPLSVVKLSLDHFYEIEQSLGEAVRDRLLKALAEIVTKSSRKNDLTCRTQLNEFALILPNCPRKGAAIRAERLRRMVESAALLDTGLKVSISLGISEFPGMCHSAETLDQSSSKALAHIYDKGGNKVCMYKAPDNHLPEYEVAAD